MRVLPVFLLVAMIVAPPTLAKEKDCDWKCQLGKVWGAITPGTSDDDTTDNATTGGRGRENLLEAAPAANPGNTPQRDDCALARCDQATARRDVPRDLPSSPVVNPGLVRPNPEGDMITNAPATQASDRTCLAAGCEADPDNPAATDRRPIDRSLSPRGADPRLRPAARQ